MLENVFNWIPNLIYIEKIIIISFVLFLISFGLKVFDVINKDIFLKTCGVIFFIEWTIILVFFTMIGRTPSLDRQLELRPFWCLQDAWINKSVEDWYLIIGNISVFIPLGVVIPICFQKLRNYKKVVVMGLIISILVELLQYITRLGLCELDDLIHNSFGCVLGYGFVLIGQKLVRKDVNNKEFVVAMVAWMYCIVFICVALYCQQPVFGYFIK